jgi:hypothetical protein
MPTYQTETRGENLGLDFKFELLDCIVQGKRPLNIQQPKMTLSARPSSL